MHGAYGEFSRFAEVIQEALNVLGPAKVTVSYSDADELYGLTLNRDQGVERSGMRVRVRMQARVIEEFGEPALSELGLN